MDCKGYGASSDPSQPLQDDATMQVEDPGTVATNSSKKRCRDVAGVNRGRNYVTGLLHGKAASNNRTGKWTVEEEVYSEFLITLFMKGSLTDCAEYTTLRAYLAKKLNCKPMRITKKYALQYDGKAMFRHNTNSTQEEVDAASEHLKTLRKNYVLSITRPKTKRSHKKRRPSDQISEGGRSSSMSSSSNDSSNIGIENLHIESLKEMHKYLNTGLDILKIPLESGLPDSPPYYTDDEAIDDGQLTPEDIELIKEAFE